MRTIKREELDLFWFPWCTYHYTTDFCKEKVAELKATGRYFDVDYWGYMIYVKVAHHPDGKWSMWNIEDLREDGIVVID